MITPSAPQSLTRSSSVSGRGRAETPMSRSPLSLHRRRASQHSSSETGLSAPSSSSRYTHISL